MVRILLSKRRPTTLLACFAFVRTSSAFASHSCHRALLRRSSNLLSMTKQVLVPIADGSEEIETTCITDTLTRFGAKVTVASVKHDNDLVCTMSRGIKVVADCTIAEAADKDWDLVALPGGMPGAEHLRDSKPLIKLLKKQKNAGKQYAAICAAPAVVLASQNLVDDGAAATCYPAASFRAKIHNVSEDAVVVSDTMTTSQGPGTALAFALQLGENLYGKEMRDKIAKEMLTK